MCSASHRRSGNRAARSATTSSQKTSVWTMPLDFVADVTYPRRLRASSRAKSTIRVTPARVNTDSCTANSSAKPRLSRPPISLYSPSTFSRTTTKSTDPASRSGLATPSKTRIGRRLTYWRKARRMGISNPQSETWSGTPGQPTAPSRIASYGRRRSMPSGGIMAPSRAYRSQDQSNSSYVRSSACRAATASSTVRAAAVTSFPMPSPGITAMRCTRLTPRARRERPSAAGGAG
jgi:hypothetical protein